MTTADTLETIEINPPEARASLIWLHGLGADGHDFEPIVPQLKLPSSMGLRFIFPHAPRQPVTINGGQVMRAWYDIRTMSFGQTEDVEGVYAGEIRLRELIQRELDRGIASERVVLAGFSQGGALAMHTGLRYPQRLGGILALSTYLPLADRLRSEMHPVNAGVPIMMAHGVDDQVIPLALGQLYSRHLADLGVEGIFHTYPMGHAVCPAEILDIRAWLLDTLGSSPGPQPA